MPISVGLAPSSSAIMEISSRDEKIAALDSRFMLSAFIQGAWLEGYKTPGLFQANAGINDFPDSFDLNLVFIGLFPDINL